MLQTTGRTGAASAAAGLRIAVSSQNFRTVTSHAGKTRRFLVYLSQDDGTVREVERLDLPMGQSLHDHHGDDHPLYRVDVVVTGGCGEGFMRRMSAHGVRVVATAERDPQTAARAAAAHGLGRGAHAVPAVTDQSLDFQS